MTFRNRLVAGGIWTDVATGIVGTVATGLTAAGSTQTGALGLSNSVNVVSTVAASTGVRLPTVAGDVHVVQSGDVVTVFNRGANALSVYPPVGGTIDSLATNAAFSVAAGKAARFFCVADNGLTWHSLLGA